MGQKLTEITDRLVEFIENQKIFFVGTATADSKVNISPKGMDSLRVLGKNRVIWLNVTGSGNETAAHVQEHPRMTIMFAAFDGTPLFDQLGDRDLLKDWASKKGDAGLQDYWTEKNQLSLDGKPTNIVEKNV